MVEVQYGLVPSMGDPRKDTSLPYILHLVLLSGIQPFSHFLISPCAIHLLLNSTSASLGPRDVVTYLSQWFVQKVAMRRSLYWHIRAIVAGRKKETKKYRKKELEEEL